MIGTQVSSRYKIVSELGRGGMGTVYQAYDPVLDRDVAIKVLNPQVLSPEAIQRFQREARAVAKMDHPSLVAIHDIGEDAGLLYFVMPFVPGTNLRSFLTDRSLRLGETVDLAIQVAEALEYSHAQGVVHRDIKPENILVSREEPTNFRVRVTDFGLAMVSSEHRLTQSGSLVGTVAYFSPEQITGKEIDGRSDIYSLGTVLYECLTGNTPFAGEIHSQLYRIVHEAPLSPRALGRNIDEDLERLVMQCLEKEPAKRPAQAMELAQSLKRYRNRLAESVRAGRLLSAGPTLEYAKPVVSLFTGREPEFAELQRRLNGAVAGECQFVVVAGEVGIGKTRLLQELETLASARKIPVLHGRFVEQDRAFPYKGFCETIQEHFRSKTITNGTDSVDFSDIATDLTALFPVLSEIEEMRAASSASGEFPASITAKRSKDRTFIFELLARALTRIGRGKPLVLLLEDLHAADVSLEALHYMVRRLGSTPTLIVATYRTTEVDKRHPLTHLLDSLRGDRRFALIRLQPFSRVEYASYVEAVLGSSNVQTRLADQLYEATEGNPFFTRELIRSLIDSGKISPDASGAWSLSGPAGLGSETLPATIQQAVERRMERLPEDLREVLSVASVLGKTFEFGDLERLVEGRTNIDDAVERLLAAGFIEEERNSRGDRFTFSSGVVRDVLYSAVPRRKRRAFHRGHAEELEKRHAGRLERVFPELLHHYTQADIPRKVIEYGLKLAHKSLSSFSAEEAVRAARTVLDYLEEEEAEKPVEAEARTLLASAYRMTGNIDAGLKELETAIRIFETEKKIDQQVNQIVMAAEMAWGARRIEETRRWVDKGIETARSAGYKETLMRLLSLGATVANLRAEYPKAKEYWDELQRLQPRVQETDKDVPRGGRLKVAISTAVVAAHPAQIRLDEEQEILANVFETLLTTNVEGGLLPCLCKHWEALENGKLFTLSLRENVRIHDGRKLNAAAVKTSLEDSVRSAGQALPPALAVIEGVAEYVSGSAGHISGLVIVSELQLEIHLIEPLPIYPALLTDMRTAVAVRASDTGNFRGTGPFRIESMEPGSISLCRNADYWKEGIPRLDAIQFRTSLHAADVAAGLRSGEFDLGGDLVPQDLDEILRNRSLRAGLVEALKKNLYFVLFNSFGPLGQVPAVAQALLGVVRAHDLVRRAQGRFAQPAEGLLPPGIFAHDPGRRRHPISREKATELLASSGLPLPIGLKASVHPILQDRYVALTRGLFEVWSDLGVEVSIETPDTASFLERGSNNQGIDFMMGRWVADYDDPDNFTYGLFHSKMGHFCRYYSSAEMDRLLEQARANSDPAARERLYRVFENQLLQSGFFLPLFHDIDYRVASRKLKNLTMRSSPPYVNYAEMGKAEAATPALEGRGGIIHVPFAGVIKNLDPALTSLTVQSEVLPNAFETLTRGTAEARIAPHLASEFWVEQQGKQFRFRLREGVRFHDGRRMTARDVRYSLERLLQIQESPTRSLLSPIRGAEQLIRGQAGDLEGFRIQSELEFTIDLVEPVSFFPALLAYTSTAIVPEGSNQFLGGWREGCVGTGPFRITRFENGQRLELEANPYYWRAGYPRSDSLIFHFGIPPTQIFEGLRAGHFSLAWNLFPADVEVLRHQPEFAEHYHEAPRLCTYYVVFNIKRGPLADENLRHRFVHSVDVESLVRRNVGRLAIPAVGLIPPGLLGHEPVPRRLSQAERKPQAGQEVALTGMMHSVYQGPYATVAEELLKTLRDNGFRIHMIEEKSEYYDKAVAAATVDFNITRWIGDYTDSDTFVHGVLHSQKGHEGRFCSLPEIDQLAEKGRAETNPALRHSIYREIEETLHRRALLLPLFYEQAYCFARPEVEGLEVGFSSHTVAYEKLWARH